RERRRGPDLMRNVVPVVKPHRRPRKDGHECRRGPRGLQVDVGGGLRLSDAAQNAAEIRRRSVTARNCPEPADCDQKQKRCERSKTQTEQPIHAFLLSNFCVFLSQWPCPGSVLVMFAETSLQPTAHPRLPRGLANPAGFSPSEKSSRKGIGL